MRLSGCRAVCLSLLLFAPGTPARAGDPPGVLRATLDNGLRVILVRNTLAPVVATSVNYLVGSDETPAGFPGTAHAQEHMMFRGSPGLTADQLAALGSAMGGRFNANTRENLTQYLFTVPAEDLDVALHVEATRMAGVLDTDKDWAEEKGAIEQEVAQDLSDPDYVLFDKLRQKLFAGTVHAYDALGTRPSFERTTAMMLKRFHDDWYAPNNAILVVAGDLDLPATLAKVKTLFGAIPTKTLPARPNLALKPVSPETVTVPSDLPYTAEILALRMPGLDSPDYAAAEVLADVLNSHRGTLYALVPAGKAIATEFSLDSLQGGSLGEAMVAFPAGGDAKAIDSELRRILSDVRDRGVSPDLIAAAKLDERRQAEFEKNSIEGLAEVWSEAVAVDGLHAPDDDLARIDKVTPEDIARVARQYLDLKGAVAGLLVPKSEGKPAAASGFGGQESIALGEGKPAQLPPWAEADLKRLALPPWPIHPTVTKLANGLTLVVQPEDVSDTVSIYGTIKNRAEMEVPKGKEGVSQVLDQLFPFGTTHLDRLAYQQALDRIGAEEHAGTEFSIEVLAPEFDRAAALLADNELAPALPARAFEVIRPEVARFVAGRNKSPEHLAQQGLRADIYPKDDPSLRQSTPATVSALTLDDVRNYYKTAFRPDLATIVVIGKTTPEAAKATIEKYFGGWRATGSPPPTELPPVPFNKAAVTQVADASRVQDLVVLAETLGLTRSNPDYYAVELGNNVLGGSFYSTRLSRDIRKNAGLVYSIDSSLDAKKTRGNYYIEYACDPKNVSKVGQMSVRELTRMQTEPVPADELDRIKALLLRKIPLGEESTAEIAQGLLARRLLDLPLDEPAQAAQHYLKLGPAEVQAAFRKWIRPNDLVRLTQGPPPG